MQLSARELRYGRKEKKTVMMTMEMKWEVFLEGNDDRIGNRIQMEGLQSDSYAGDGVYNHHERERERELH